MKKNEMTLDQLYENCKCCVCDQPLTGSKNLNAIQLPYKVTWEFPRWGNILTKQDYMGLSFLCDGCMNPTDVQNIKYAVEVRDGEVVYHELSTLTREEILHPTNPQDN